MSITEHLDDERTRAKEARGAAQEPIAPAITAAYLSLIERAEQAEQEVAQLRAAMEFYADQQSYESENGYDFPAVVLDEGKRARAALTGKAGEP